MIRVSPILKQDDDAGYQITRPLYTKDHWLFRVDFALIRPASMIYMTDFFHDHRGGTAFYFKTSFGLYGIPETYALADPGGISPWSSEVDPGYGESPTWLVRFVSDRLGFKRLRKHDNYWGLTEPMELITL
jgi:hypothetical protein